MNVLGMARRVRVTHAATDVPGPLEPAKSEALLASAYRPTLVPHGNSRERPAHSIIASGRAIDRADSTSGRPDDAILNSQPNILESHSRKDRRFTLSHTDLGHRAFKRLVSNVSQFAAPCS